MVQRITKEMLTELMSSYYDKVRSYHDTEQYLMDKSFKLKDKNLKNKADRLHKIRITLENVMLNSFELYGKLVEEPNERGQVHAKWYYDCEMFTNNRVNIFWDKFIKNDEVYLKYNKERLIEERIKAMQEDF